MKCIYMDSDVTKASAALLICSISLDNLYSTPHERHFRHCFPEAHKTVTQMLTESVIVTKDMLPVLGDVIWVTGPGGKTLGFCIVREKRDDDINKDAVRTVMECVNRKAVELEEQGVGMDLFGCGGGMSWARIVDIIEESLPNVQAVVCIPSANPQPPYNRKGNWLLNEVLRILEGTENEPVNVFSLERVDEA